jgi:hypothetical protein
MGVSKILIVIPKTVVPAKAGTQFDVRGGPPKLDPGLRRDDGL